ncbi:heme NO-binding protein [Paracoccus sp. S-4012]|uniref:heme NO-binding domain-containing protein n=1 Tax=Paracoccus sp. S-4012 TaxID=2665648 RepID=UPI0012B0D8B1|nr:heme NO-binding domain-containing protein [Paracoccus sp. S-4012]MRX51264.1 heme NO-binding protein [Paracoccus sp. S-4012]
MHGLVNHTIQEFVCDSYGEAAWAQVAARIDCPEGFAPFRHYPDRLTLQLIAASAATLGKPAEEMLEDLGAWLARMEPARRLLRFSGADFGEFVLSLEELQGRAHLVLPDLEMPRFSVTVSGRGRFRVGVSRGAVEWQSVLAGLLRAMSDDYGALALIVDEGAAIAVDVSDEAFSAARDFDLAAGPALRGAVA